MLLRKFNELSILVGVFPRHWSTNHLRERKERISRRRRITYFQFWCSWRHWSDRRWSQTRCLARNRQQPAPTLPGKAEIYDELMKNSFLNRVLILTWLCMMASTLFLLSISLTSASMSTGLMFFSSWKQRMLLLHVLEMMMNKWCHISNEWIWLSESVHMQTNTNSLRGKIIKKIAEKYSKYFFQILFLWLGFAQDKCCGRHMTKCGANVVSSLLRDIIEASPLVNLRHRQHLQQTTWQNINFQCDILRFTRFLLSLKSELTSSSLASPLSPLVWGSWSPDIFTL